ncbi:DNA methylase N-4/N-6 domain protein [Thermoanaerobacter sp. YS13]|nr:DNA methylase N-4/N-6 domain protein [Thermoanaerobacter sp. YS13]
MELNNEKIQKYDNILVYDSPKYLPFWYEKLSNFGFSFKYHIVIHFEPEENTELSLPVSHVGVLIFSKNFKINKVRIPHAYCSFCGETLKDWGGKKHLMHPEGTLISDVWKHLNLSAHEIIGNRVPDKVYHFFELMFGRVDREVASREIQQSEDKEITDTFNFLPDEAKNKVMLIDLIEGLKELPDNSIDMIFIDPPYNLGKPYANYHDERGDYIDWTIKWINDCFRVLKPQGSLFYLNIPKWAHEVAYRLIPRFYLQRWIVWDNQGEPRGKLIPAHYSILWLSKTAAVKSHYLGNEQRDYNFCLREKCRKQRKLNGVNDRVKIRDVRWDIHRIKHASKRLEHPNQLPEKLLDFLIRLSTDKNDIVLDPMVGTGTTVVVAKNLSRAYLGFEIDPKCVDISQKRLKGDCLNLFSGQTHTIKKAFMNKKDIQIKVGELAKQLGRLPDINEVENYLGINQSELFTIFNSWSKVLKYAKLMEVDESVESRR